MVSNLCILIKVYKNDKGYVYSLTCVYVRVLNFFSTFNLWVCSNSNYPPKSTQSSELRVYF